MGTGARWDKILVEVRGRRIDLAGFRDIIVNNLAKVKHKGRVLNQSEARTPHHVSLAYRSAKKRAFVPAIVLGICLLLGAGVGAAQPALGSVEREIQPTQTDSSIPAPNDPSFVVTPNPGVPARNRLFVMIPGTGATPKVYHLVVEEAAKRGYHAIGLAYASKVAVGTACEHAATATCFGDVRQKMITGQNTTALVDISPQNSIVHRLDALLRYLAATYPDEGWGQYLTPAGEVAWTKLHVGGHSQGSGDAGYMTKLFPLARACFFSFGYDKNASFPMPAWLNLPNVTPASHMYGFINTHDEIVNINYAEAEWKILGMFAFGEPVSVDGAMPPYGGTHMLTTSLAPAAGTQPNAVYPEHSEPIADVRIPKNPDGSPVTIPAWDAMCFP